MSDLPVMMFESNWQTLSILAALVSFFIGGIFLMVSRLFSSPKLEQTAKGEMVFAASTVFLALFIALLIPLAEEASVDYVKSVYGGSFNFEGKVYLADIALAYMSNVATCAKNFLNVLWAIDIQVQLVLSIVMEVVMSDLATGFFMNFFSDRIKNFTEVLTFFLIIFYLIYNILIFLKYFGMYFFTFGIILRAFPPTRGGGAFIMALSIGLYFIFPLTYILTGMIMQESGGPVVCDMTTLPKIDNCKICAKDALGVEKCRVAEGTIDTSKNERIVCSTAGALDVKKIFANSLKLKVSTNWFTEVIDKAHRFLNNIIMTMCFLPLLAMTLTLSFILSTSSLFGATIPEVGRGLIKLI